MKTQISSFQLLLLLILSFALVFSSCEQQTDNVSQRGGIPIVPPGDLGANKRISFLYFLDGTTYRTAAGGLGTIVIRDNMKTVRTAKGYRAYQKTPLEHGKVELCFDLYSNPDLAGSPQETFCVNLMEHDQVLIESDSTGSIFLQYEFPTAGG